MFKRPVIAFCSLAAVLLGTGTALAQRAYIGEAYPVPEPATLVFLGMGVLLFRRRRR